MVSHLVFSPTQNLIAWTDADGTLSRWPNPVPSTSPDPVKPQTTSNTVVPLKKISDPLSFGVGDEDGSKNVPGGLEDATGDDSYGMYDDDWMIDDIGILDRADDEKDQNEEGYAKEMGKSLDSHFFSVLICYTVSVTKAQPAFQPASTPMANKKRYLGMLDVSSVLCAVAF